MSETWEQTKARLRKQGIAVKEPVIEPPKPRYEEPKEEPAEPRFDLRRDEKGYSILVGSSEAI